MTGKENLIKANLKVFPFEISDYFPTEDEDDNKWKTQIYLKNGQSYMIELTVEKFEEKLNSHQK